MSNYAFQNLTHSLKFQLTSNFDESGSWGIILAIAVCFSFLFVFRSWCAVLLFPVMSRTRCEAGEVSCLGCQTVISHQTDAGRGGGSKEGTHVRYRITLTGHRGRQSCCSFISRSILASHVRRMLFHGLGIGLDGRPFSRFLLLPVSEDMSRQMTHSRASS